jgi:hypothetical protein
VKLKIDLQSILISLMGMLTAFFSWDGNYEGGDIALARSSFLGEETIDLWGSISGLFYGYLPNLFLPWGAWLLLLQISLTVIGLMIIRNCILMNSNLEKFCFFIFSYLILNFNSFLTRDSTMSSFFVVGLALIIKSNISSPDKLKKASILGYLLISFATSFRPWLFLVVSLIFICMQKITLKFFPALIAFSMLPLLFNVFAYTSSDFRKVHPEVQVIVMDIASMSCLSSSNQTRSAGTKILNQLNNTLYSNSEICSSFRINTWQSVANWQLTKTQINRDTSFDNNLSNSRILISSKTIEQSYQKIRESWINYIKLNFRDYIQIKFVQFAQLGIAGDTSGFRIQNRINFFGLISGLYFVLFDLVITLHLLSVLITFLVGIVVIYRYLSEYSIREVLLFKSVTISFTFLFTWLTISTIAFIGDNGRYTYLSSFIFYLLLIFGVKKFHSKSTEKI